MQWPTLDMGKAFYCKDRHTSWVLLSIRKEKAMVAEFKCGFSLWKMWTFVGMEKWEKTGTDDGSQMPSKQRKSKWQPGERYWLNWVVGLPKWWRGRWGCIKALQLCSLLCHGLAMGLGKDVLADFSGARSPSEGFNVAFCVSTQQIERK